MAPPCPDEKAICPDQRLPVVFPHEMHMGLFDCLDCHHEYEKNGSVNILDPATLYVGNPELLCGFCHNGKSRINREDAFHRQCIGCHLETGRIDGPVEPPALCGQCHAPGIDAAGMDLILGESHD